jgi:hypothetical protein
MKTFTLACVAVLVVGLRPDPAFAQGFCPAVTVDTGLQLPVAITRSNLGSLLVAEGGTSAANSGRISILDADGSRRPLLEGLPSGINDVGEPSGPAGLAMRGRTLYVAIGVGDVGRPGPLPGTTVPNSNPPASPLFSSILALHFSAQVERTTSGFVLSSADHQALADGRPVTLSYGAGQSILLEKVADFENYVPNPLPFFAGNVRLSNPFGIVEHEDRLYVTDGGRNLVWAVDVATGGASVLAAFAPIPNPVAPFGPPVLDAVPTGITRDGNRLLVALFRGFPFPPGTSTIQAVNPSTGAQSVVMAGLKTAIAITSTRDRGELQYLLLQHVSGTPGPPQTSGPGSLSRVDPLGGGMQPLADCLVRPTAMAVDVHTGVAYLTEYGGRVVAVPTR